MLTNAGGAHPKLPPPRGIRPSTNNVFGPARVHTRNDISIRSSVLAQLVAMSDRQTDMHTESHRPRYTVTSVTIRAWVQHANYSATERPLLLPKSLKMKYQSIIIISGRSQLAKCRIGAAYSRWSQKFNSRKNCYSLPVSKAWHSRSARSLN